MADPQDDLRRILTELSSELTRAADQANRLVRQAYGDLVGMAAKQSMPGPFKVPKRSGPPAEASGPSPKEAVELIKLLGELREAGLITETEFQDKKAQLLERIA